MFPSFGCCSGSNSDPEASRRAYQERKLRMLTFWRDGVERQLAAVSAAINTLEQQMHRDGPSTQN
ncbi:sigma factor SigF [Synechococcus sp. CS-602]|uniref:sigma factor SigF n=1 Tax=unclassified Synechococcus TaxID=2626047 RepID=UPI0008FF3A7A|nr:MULTISPECIES: sigma factor SigF [unclassified Synechococcus]MCT0202282.1 sigma factor SigF [Synechococcus sp. CS-603]MCT0204579.1 sigma factor SigF [Synechococcus sp. CS-602]MCT0246363.1 sigma factor SigF [Synechococcus sp. CS-601]TWB93375.1 hypothetical protein FB106_104158 [Synechococcus sp. Ace-Pa]